MKNTFTYIDGFNLYNGMMDENNYIPGDPSPIPLRKYLWLNLHDLILSYLPLDYKISKLYYFTSPILNDEPAKKRQQVYWKAIKRIPGADIQLGKFKPSGNSTAEKQTDVKIALQMYCDALENDDICMVLMSGDSDQVPTLKRIIGLKKNIELYVLFPPSRVSEDLRDLIPNHCSIGYKHLRAYQFPDVIHRGNAPDIIRPIEWT